MRGLLLPGLLLAACAPSPAPPGVVVLGTINFRQHGDDRWVDIRDAQEAELAPGAQGGFHVWLRFRTNHISGRVRAHRIADRVTGERRDRVLTTEGIFLIQPPEGRSEWETPDPIPNFMCPTPIGISIIDQLIEMSLRLETPEGALLAESRARVTARCPPEGDDQRAFCLQICSG